MKTERVLVAMSGGTRSAVTAALLKSEGYDVVAVHFDFSGTDGLPARCREANGSAEAARIAAALGIEIRSLDASGPYLDQVIDRAVHEVVQLRAPNPCLSCNARVKFPRLFAHADSLGIERVATGHFAQTRFDPVTGVATLHQGADPNRDQSYFLFTLSQAELRRLLLPMGALSEIMIAKLAYQLGLDVKVEATAEPCFTNTAAFARFVEDHVPVGLRPVGIIRTDEGQVLGEHDGLTRYELGTRKGLGGVGGREAQEWVTIGFDPGKQALVVGSASRLSTRSLVATDLSWSRPIDGLRGLRAWARVRPGLPKAPCLVTSFENRTAHVEFIEPQGGVAPGQAIVFYVDDEVLGGGFIERSETL